MGSNRCRIGNNIGRLGKLAKHSLGGLCQIMACMKSVHGPTAGMPLRLMRQYS